MQTRSLRRAKRQYEEYGISIPGTKLAWPTEFTLDYQLDKVVLAGAKWFRFDIF